MMRQMLPLAARIGKPEVDIFDLVLLDQRHHIAGIRHRSVPSIELTTNPTRLELRWCSCTVAPHQRGERLIGTDMTAVLNWLTRAIGLPSPERPPKLHPGRVLQSGCGSPRRC